MCKVCLRALRNPNHTCAVYDVFLSKPQPPVLVVVLLPQQLPVSIEYGRRTKAPVIIDIPAYKRSIRIIVHPAQRSVSGEFHICIVLIPKVSRQMRRHIYPFCVLRPRELQIREHRRLLQRDSLQLVEHRPAGNPVKTLPVQKPAEPRRPPKAQNLRLLSRIPEHPKVVYRIIKFVGVSCLVPRQNISLPVSPVTIPGRDKTIHEPSPSAAAQVAFGGSHGFAKESAACNI